MNTQWMDATETAAHIREGRLTSLEAVGQALARIRARDPILHAFVLVLEERAVALARARDMELTAGVVRGPLHGVPVAVKDLFDIAGYRTGAGSRSLPEHKAEISATAVRKLEEAGAVIVGKTHTVELAFGGWGTNPVLGAPRNPFDLARYHRAPGGSSSGSAVAVASGMVPLALGTDTGGSIRIPAAFCGLFGHKPSPGLIGRGGTRYLSPSHDTIGPLARSVRDIETALEVLAGSDERDPAIPVHLANPHVREAGRLRIATVEDDAISMLSAEVRSRFEHILGPIEATCGKVEAIRLPAPMAEMCERAGRLMSAESYASLRDISENPEMDMAPEIRRRINLGREISAADLIGFHDLKKRWKRAFLEAFSAFDLLVLPGAAILPPVLEDIDQSNMVLSIFGRFVNMLDLCATSAPLGLSAVGLPIGVQIVARPGEDSLSLRLAADLENRRLACFVAPPLDGLTAPSVRDVV